MKRKIVVLLLTISIPFVMVACSKSDAGKHNKPQEMVEAPSEVSIPKEETAETQIVQTETMTDEEVIKECLRLLGKNDDEAAKIWNGGKQNYTEDGEFLIGRIFEVKVFGEKTTANTIYSETGIANSLTVELAGKDAAPYKEELNKIFGEVKEKTETPSEGGYTYTMWEDEGKEIYLYESGGLITLQLTMPEK